MTAVTDPPSTPVLPNAYETAECGYFSAGSCRSCELLIQPHGSRVSEKLKHLMETLAAHGLTPARTNPIVLPSHPWQSRHKVKMAISGDCNSPIIGLAALHQPSNDLVDCCLTPQPIRDLLRHLRGVIGSHKLTPYNIEERVGELKHLIVMTTADGSQGILRFVLRSSEAIPRVKKSMAGIQEAFPWIKVISCNIQPQPAAILEGPEEVVLTQDRVVREAFGDVPLYLAPQSFMQVTPQVAQALYSRAAHHIERAKPTLMLDLFCGVGGFSLHAARYSKRVIGVELSYAAIESAHKSAQELQYTNCDFHVSDVETFLSTNSQLRPDLVIVNPPRRGLSNTILSLIQEIRPRVVLYSSCAPDTFARDARILQSTYTLQELTPFDMFPMTLHCEVLGAFTLAG